MSGMRPLEKLISLEDALKICDSNSFQTQKKEIVPIRSAAGRVLAENVKASINVPPFARSAMDGYAVRIKDVREANEENPVFLSIIDKIYAGDVPKKRLAPMQCSEIATGGMLPDGADSIVMVEDTRKITRIRVEILHPQLDDNHIISPGDDIKKGNIVGNKGDFLTPAKIGSLSAIGKEEISVFQKPRIVVMPTGNEVIRPGKKLEPGQIYDVNTYTLSSAIELFGGQVIVKPIVGDDRQSLIRSIGSSKGADMIIFSGGSSVGEKDLIIDAVNDVGKVLFHGVAIRPGKPTLLGKVGKCLVFGMPGHPTSCLSNAYIFLEPLIRKIGRYPIIQKRIIHARLATDINPAKGRTTIMTVKMKEGLAHLAFKESSAITSMANADGYIVIPPREHPLGKDSDVEVVLF